MKRVESKEEEPKRNLTLDRDEEIIPVVRILLLKLAMRPDLMMGSNQSTSPEALSKYYQKVYQEDVAPLLIDANIKVSAIDYVFSLMQQPVQLLGSITKASFDMNRDIADAKKYGVASIEELRVQDLDAALKS